MKLIQILILLVFLLVILTSCSKELTKYVCSDGQTVSEPSLCPKVTPEPGKLTYVCPDGTRVNNLDLCPQEVLENNQIFIAEPMVMSHSLTGYGPDCLVEKITNETYVSSCDVPRKSNSISFVFDVWNEGDTILRDVFCGSTCDQYLGDMNSHWLGLGGPFDACIMDGADGLIGTKFVLMKPNACKGEYDISFGNLPTNLDYGRYICNLTCYSNVTPTRESKEIIFTAKFID